ncbi:MFS transporter, partial [Micromonospora aurantiaca]|nr:MFS transporter [Micromonospora aurantiaca]
MPRLTRDRITWLTYAQLGLWGFFLYGFGPVVPLLRDEQGTSAAVAGLHSTGIAVGALAGGALFAPAARRLGRG